MKFQRNTWSCGAATVRNILRCFGLKVSELDIRTYSNTSKEFGTSENGIMDSIRAFGYTAVEHHFDDSSEAWEWLHDTLYSGKPVILAVENWEHWVAAIGSLGRTGIVVFDPSNFKVNKHENGTHVWDKKKLIHKWKNDRKSIDEDNESRMYAISIGKK